MYDTLKKNPYNDKPFHVPLHVENILVYQVLTPYIETFIKEYSYLKYPLRIYHKLHFDKRFLRVYANQKPISFHMFIRLYMGR